MYARALFVLVTALLAASSHGCNCVLGTVCVGGRCVSPRRVCALKRCAAGTRCVLGMCLKLPKTSCLGIRCPPGMRCIFGNCRKRQTRRCTVRNCSRRGSLEPCRMKRCHICSRRVVTCRFWARTAKPKCTWSCRTRCLPAWKQPRDSAGKLHCTRCSLMKYSCQRRFTVFGPIDPTKMDMPKLPVKTPALPAVPAKPSVLPVTPPKLPVRAPKLPVAAPKLPVSTPSRPSSAAPAPSMSFCTLNTCAEKGASYKCRLHFTTTTCGAWGRSSRGPSCRIPCPRTCERGPRAPRDNKGRLYCNLCLLRVRSCTKMFTVYAPVRRPLRKLPASTCSLATCSRFGAGHKCKTSSRFGKLTVLRTFSCGAWGRTSSARRICGFRCAPICVSRSIAPRDNNARPYCNLCALRFASCISQFTIYGPVLKSKPPAPARAPAPPTPSARPRPVTKLPTIPKPPSGPTPEPEVRRCSTGGGLVTPSRTCRTNEVCVLDDFGFPAADRPNAGSCRTVPTPIAQCSLNECVARGASQVCRATVTNDITTCSTWQNRTDGSSNANCAIFCTLECVPNRLCDNAGNRYCNACLLSAASCRAAFNIFGPVPCS